jgi:hypothetical protein
VPDLLHGAAVDRGLRQLRLGVMSREVVPPDLGEPG